MILCSLPQVPAAEAALAASGHRFVRAVPVADGRWYLTGADSLFALKGSPIFEDAPGFRLSGVAAEGIRPPSAAPFADSDVSGWGTGLPDASLSALMSAPAPEMATGVRAQSAEEPGRRGVGKEPVAAAPNSPEDRVYGFVTEEDEATFLAFWRDMHELADEVGVSVAPFDTSSGSVTETGPDETCECGRHAPSGECSACANKGDVT